MKKRYNQTLWFIQMAHDNCIYPMWGLDLGPYTRRAAARKKAKNLNDKANGTSAYKYSVIAYKADLSRVPWIYKKFGE